jgi:hypothetical protein
MANKEKGTGPVCCDLRVTQVYQDRDAVRRNTNIIGLNIAMNKRRMLAMKEMNSIANS